MKHVASIGLLCVCVLVLNGCTGKGADELLDSAESYMDKGDLRAAEVTLKQILTEVPGQAVARGLLGALFYQQGGFSEAAAHWSKLPKLDPIYIQYSGDLIVARALIGDGELLSMQPEMVATQYRTRLQAFQTLKRAYSQDISLGEALAVVSQETAEASYDDLVYFCRAQLLLLQNSPDDARQAAEAGLALNPESFLNQSILGDVSLAQGDLDQALSWYGEVVKKYPVRVPERYKRAVIYIEQNKYELAHSDLKILQKLVPDSIAVKYAQGISDFYLKNYDAAIENLKASEQTINLFPKALFYLASSNLTLGNLEQSTDYAERYYASNPDNPAAVMMLASLYVSQGKFTEVVSAMEPVYSQLKKSPDAVVQYASALISMNRGDEAIAVMDEALGAGVKSEDLYALQANYALSRDNMQRVYDILSEGKKFYPDNDKLSLVQILYDFKMSDYDKAVDDAKSFVDKNNRSAFSLNMLADVYKMTGDLESAKAVLDEIVNRHPGDRLANMKLAAIARSENDYHAALQYYDNILKANPEDKQIIVNGFGALLAMQEKREALERINKAIDRFPYDLSLKDALAKYYLQSGEPGRVASVYGSVLEEVYRNPVSYGLFIRAKLSEKNYDEAISHLKRLSSVIPESPSPYYMMASAYAAQGDQANTYKYLQASLAIDPDFPPAELAYAKYLSETGSKEKFGAVVAELVKKYPSSLDAQILQVRYYEAQGDIPLATQQAKDLYLRTEAESALNYWAYLCVKSKSLACLDDAGSKYQIRTVQDVPAQMGLANSYLVINAPEKAVTVYQSVLQIQPDNIVALNNIAWLYRDSEPKRALEYSTRAIRLSPESAALMDTHAQSQLSNGLGDEALQTIRKAMAKDPENETIKFHYAMISNEVGKVSEAKQLLRDLLADGQDFPEREKASRMLVELESR